MELVVRQFRWQEQFHGIPWKFGCTSFDDSSSSMEFHGTQGAPISLTRAVPWNSIPWTWSAPLSLTREVPWNSMGLGVRQFCWHEQFHGFPWNSMELGVRQFRWHEKFHGIPWNLEYANFNDTSNSMEFHGTRSAPISLVQAVPLNSMELRMRQIRWHEQFHGICHGTWSAPISLTREVAWNSMEFHGTWSAPISLKREVPLNSMDFHGT